jgi:mono/diheme cytochrome c family protein
MKLEDAPRLEVTGKERVMRNKWLAIVAGLGMIGASASGVLAADAGGKAIFDKSCVGCHGADGKGNPGMAKVLGEKGLNLTAKEVGQMSDDQLLKVVSEGKGKMPAQSKLSKDEQKAVVSYVRSLSK